MQRYFIAKKQIRNGLVTFTSDDAHHIQRVMRMDVGEKIIICNEDGVCHIAILVEMGEKVVARIFEPLTTVTEMPVQVTIAQGLPKGDKLELVLQKGTECGAFSFIPVAMERSVVRLDPIKSLKKLERWQKIAKEAAEQSHRQRVPQVHPVTPFSAFLQMSGEFDLKLFAFEETAKSGEMPQLKESLAQMAPGSSILVVVGPEGGISPKEAVALMGAGFLPCALGPRILRTETAPLYILSAVSYAMEL